MSADAKQTARRIVNAALVANGEPWAMEMLHRRHRERLQEVEDVYVKVGRAYADVRDMVAAMVRGLAAGWNR